jgi:hypothetical protein
MTANETNSVIELLNDTDNLLQTLEECRCKTTGRISVPSQEEFDYISDIREYIKEFLGTQKKRKEPVVIRKFLVEAKVIDDPNTDDCQNCCFSGVGLDCSDFCEDISYFEIKSITRVTENDDHNK